MLFLTGVFFPRGTMPGWLQVITQYLPLTYVIDALRAVAVEGVSLWAVRSDLVGILAWLVISVLIAIRLFRWETA
jgi:ABC-2 type transport system permease protein